MTEACHNRAMSVEKRILNDCDGCNATINTNTCIFALQFCFISQVFFIIFFLFFFFLPKGFLGICKLMMQTEKTLISLRMLRRLILVFAVSRT